MNPTTEVRKLLGSLDPGALAVVPDAASQDADLRRILTSSTAESRVRHIPRLQARRPMRRGWVVGAVAAAAAVATAVFVVGIPSSSTSKAYAVTPSGPPLRGECSRGTGYGSTGRNRRARRHSPVDLSLNIRALMSQRLIPRESGAGRIAAMEIMLNSPLIQDLIFKGEVAKIKEVMSRSTRLGMKTFDQALFELYETGFISYEDALRNADSKNELRLRDQAREQARGQAHR